MCSRCVLGRRRRCLSELQQLGLHLRDLIAGPGARVGRGAFQQAERRRAPRVLLLVVLWQRATRRGVVVRVEGRLVRVRDGDVPPAEGLPVCSFQRDGRVLQKARGPERQWAQSRHHFTRTIGPEEGVSEHRVLSPVYSTKAYPRGFPRSAPVLWKR